MLERVNSRVAIVAGLAVAALAGGCQSTSPLRAPDTGLAALGNGAASTTPSSPTPEKPTETEISRMAEESARFLETRNQPKSKPDTRPSTRPKTPTSVARAPLDISAPAPTAPERDSRTSNNGSGQQESAPSEVVAKAQDDPPAQAKEPEPTLVPRDALAAELGSAVAKAIRVLKAEPGSEPTIGNLVAALEAVRPGFLTEVGNLDSPIVEVMGAANAAEIFNHRQFVPAASAPEVVAKAQEATPPPATPVLSIATAQLCSKVTSFGRYDLLPSDTFAADQPIRALVYAEIENFADQEAGDGQRAVELSQRLALYRENESRDVWSTSEQTVREVARRARRDFYLVQQIDLPRNLSLGSYTLKVTVTDKINGAQAEWNLPIRIVVGQRSATGE